MATREENLAKLAAWKSAAEEAATRYNGATAVGNFEAAHEADNEISKAIEDYTALARMMAFEDCKSTEDPMLTAVTKLRFTTITAKRSRKEEITSIAIEEKEMPIDLLELDKFCGGIGHDPHWKAALQRANCLMTARVAVDLGLDPKRVYDNYYMTEFSSKIDAGETPTSNTKILEEIQTVITAMLGDGYKALSCDARYLRIIYARKDNKQKLSVTCANHKKFCGYIAEVANRVITNGVYNANYKTK